MLKNTGSHFQNSDLIGMGYSLDMEIAKIPQKGQLVSDNPGYLAKEIYKQSIEGTAWLLLITVKHERRQMN